MLAGVIIVLFAQIAPLKLKPESGREAQTRPPP